ncbi:MAG: hypothetical protein VR64_14605 [Desulfatitalea sp. BRH_c12]|jgi:hypothetical protein|nr:MAG: hypothetical protein VR64_14605 [Desulfatitalea sp. BRH_c12]
MKSNDMVDTLGINRKGPKTMPKSAKLPWEEANPDIIKQFQLRLPLPIKLQAEKIVANSLRSEYSSLQDFFIKAILVQIEKEKEKLYK